MTWQFGILTDCADHVHLGAFVGGSQFSSARVLDLLTPVGACSVRDRDLHQMVVPVHGEQLDDMRRLAERCIDDERLRDRLVALLELSAVTANRRDERSGDVLKIAEVWLAWVERKGGHKLKSA